MGNTKITTSAPLSVPLRQALTALNVSRERPIAGSFATWLWNLAVTGCTPSWTFSDVDVWYDSASRLPFKDAVGILEAVPGATAERRGPAIVEVRIPTSEAGTPPQVIQLIRRNLSEGRGMPYGVLDLFDISVCQVAITSLTFPSPGKIKATFVFVDKETRQEIITRTGRVFRDLKDSAFQGRIQKYKDRGFTLRQGKVVSMVPWGVTYKTPLLNTRFIE